MQPAPPAAFWGRERSVLLCDFISNPAPPLPNGVLLPVHVPLQRVKILQEHKGLWHQGAAATSSVVANIRRWPETCCPWLETCSAPAVMNKRKLLLIESSSFALKLSSTSSPDSWLLEHPVCSTEISQSVLAAVQGQWVLSCSTA